MRQPNPQKLAEAPDERAQQLHMLTHLPFQDWCPHCVAHRSRPDRHLRDGSVKDSGVATVSFDFAYTKAVAPGGNVQETEQVIALVLVGSMANFTGCVPISKKNDFDLMVREILQFTQVLGHSECTFLCDNEPAIMQVQKRAVPARQMMGLVTPPPPESRARSKSSSDGLIGSDKNSACLLRHSAECRVPGACIPDSQLGECFVGSIPAGKPGILGNGCDGTTTAGSLGSATGSCLSGTTVSPVLWLRIQ